MVFPFDLESNWILRLVLQIMKHTFLYQLVFAIFQLISNQRFHNNISIDNEGKIQSERFFQLPCYHQHESFCRKITTGRRVVFSFFQLIWNKRNWIRSRGKRLEVMDGEWKEGGMRREGGVGRLKISWKFRYAKFERPLSDMFGFEVRWGRDGFKF